MNETKYQVGDIFLTRGDNFISRAIRVFTRSDNESRTMVNHVGVVVENAQTNPLIIEALSPVVKKRRLMDAYGKPRSSRVMVIRPRYETLTPDNELAQSIHKYTVAVTALEYEGKKYGHVKLVAHFLDWCLGGRYVFRRLARMDDYPICSWVVAYAADSVGWDFGVEPNGCSPDDVYDHWYANPDKYHLVHTLRKLGSKK